LLWKLYRLDDLLILHAWTACHGPRYERSEQLPLLTGEFMATYHPTVTHYR
jgi:hypothetical protein